jgi:hypothetical protein
MATASRPRAFAAGAGARLDAIAIRKQIDAVGRR